LNETTSGVLYSPIAEEFVFKFLLMKKLLHEYFKFSPMSSNIIQSLCFGVLHKSNSIFSNQTQSFTNIQGLCATINGFISGWVYQKSNSIIPCLLAHMINNAVAGVSEVVGYSDFLNE
jgi:membrane protease YdiL (CAAX protease family)